jgi:hypothetical protein
MASPARSPALRSAAQEDQAAICPQPPHQGCDPHRLAPFLSPPTGALDALMPNRCASFAAAIVLVAVIIRWT